MLHLWLPIVVWSLLTWLLQVLALTRLHKWRSFLHQWLCLFEGWLCWSGSWRLWPFFISFCHDFWWLPDSCRWPLLSLGDYSFLSLWRCKLASNRCPIVKVAVLCLTCRHCWGSGGTLLHFRRDRQTQFFMFQLFLRHYRCHVSRAGLECSYRSDNVCQLFRCLSRVAVTCSINRQRRLTCRCLGVLVCWLTKFILRIWYGNFAAIFYDWLG